ncbi:MAG: hypothetical protein WAL04_14425, partial [Acidimicrobiales bacterium]
QLHRARASVPAGRLRAPAQAAPSRAGADQDPPRVRAAPAEEVLEGEAAAQAEASVAAAEV